MNDKKKNGGWRSLFVKEVEGEEEEQLEAPVPQGISTPNIPSSTYIAPVITNNSNVFESKLKEVISNQSSEYVKFKKAVDDLKSVLPDEATRIKSTFVSMRALGITKETLISAAKASHNLVSREQVEFENAMNAAYSSQVDGAVSKINSLNSQIEAKINQISMLQSEVDKMKIEKDNLENSIEQNKSSIQTARNDFSAAYNKVCEEINSDINKINSNL